MKENSQILFETRSQLRSWLEKNHTSKDGFWLVYYKKSSGLSQLTMDDIVDEALCFGWIDSTVKKVDEQKNMLWLSPRKPKSNWCKINKDKVPELIANNLMQPSGLKMVELAKKTGTWDALNDVENLIVPADLQAAFDQNPISKENWLKYSKSPRKVTLEWLLNAKRPETRQSRIQTILEKTSKMAKLV
jgi:uncharacterized protein YdeI (YjbR/CyaY-like superfamily)